MKVSIHFLFAIIAFIIFGCTNSNSAGPQNSANKTTSGVAGNEQQKENTIVGEWQQRFTCFDKNGNYKLEPQEKTASGTRLGFDWFRFNVDGSCLRDQDIQFKGSYSIQEKNGKQKLVIEGGDNLRYTIEELTSTELILGSSGAFIVFKKIE